MHDPVNDGAAGRPAPALRPFVERYVGYRQAGFSPGTHQGLPSHNLTFIVSLHDPVDIASMPDPSRQSPGAFQAFVSGLHAGPAVIRHDGNQHGVSLDLTPAGARALFGLPAAAVASVVVDLTAVLGPLGTELVDRLVETSTWSARFAILDEVLHRALHARRPTEVAPEVAEAWRQVVASGGTVEVAALADEVGWSRRHLLHRFRSELGLAPKVAARVVRFERSVTLLKRPQSPPLADVAVRCGYFDQPHLNRDWRELAGMAPTRWRAEELPSVQDDSLVAVTH